MKLSELIREYVNLKIEGEPKSSDWVSIDESSSRRREYLDRLEELEEAIDDAAEIGKAKP